MPIAAALPMRGRKPKPTVLKLLSGSKKPIIADEPIPLGNLTIPPESLSEREAQIWRRVIARAPVGLLRELDSDIVEMYCQTWVQREEHLKKVREFGAVVKSPTQGVPQVSPYQVLARQCTEILKGLMSDLGFNPTSRSRISTSGAGPSKTNRFANNAAKKPA